MKKKYKETKRKVMHIMITNQAQLTKLKGNNNA